MSALLLAVRRCLRARRALCPRVPCRAVQAELVETVATIAYSETSNGMAQGEPTLPDAELCTGALDKLALVTAVRMDPDLHKIFAVAVDV